MVINPKITEIEKKERNFAIIKITMWCICVECNCTNNLVNNYHNIKEPYSHM